MPRSAADQERAAPTGHCLRVTRNCKNMTRIYLLGEGLVRNNRAFSVTRQGLPVTDLDCLKRRGNYLKQTGNGLKMIRDCKKLFLNSAIKMTRVSLEWNICLKVAFICPKLPRMCLKLTTDLQKRTKVRLKLTTGWLSQTEEHHGMPTDCQDLALDSRLLRPLLSYWRPVELFQTSFILICLFIAN